jgi:deoxyribodipyrimidine photo-lyase
MATSIVWFRSDLRLYDNAALSGALRSGKPIVPVFIWAPDEETPWQPGSAARWWLHRSLASLDSSLRQRGSALVLRQGKTLEALRALVRETEATAVYWNRRCEPAFGVRDDEIGQVLAREGVRVHVSDSSFLYAPEDVRTRDGKPFTVFTPFWKACLAEGDPPAPLPAPSAIPVPYRMPESVALSALALEPAVDWAQGLRHAWDVGESTALRFLDEFAESGISGYGVARDFPGERGTSRLSPYLHHGEVSPRSVWNRLRSAGGEVDGFLRQLIWREFAHHLLFHFPHTTADPLRSEFNRFPWRSDASVLLAWQRGRTGYPLVDAGMRELWTTGWQHNRVRMLTASFLTKDLLISWKEGARWFWDTLVDADLANNSLGWQWVAGCGADAAPYFRVFNPVLQAGKFDGNGSYVRQWIPELAPLPNMFIHRPWEAPSEVLRSAGIELGVTYPRRIVDHVAARKRALQAYERLKARKNEPIHREESEYDG